MIIKFLARVLFVFTIICSFSGCGGEGNKNQTSSTQQTTNSSFSSTTTTTGSSQTPQPTSTQFSPPTTGSSNGNPSSVIISNASTTDGTCGDQYITSGQYDEMIMALTKNPDISCTGGWKEIYDYENCTYMNKIPETNQCYHAGVDFGKYDIEGRSAFAGVYGYVSYPDGTIPTFDFGRVTIKVNDNLYCSALHLKSIYVSQNDFVCPDTEIGLIGLKGAGAAHLHYECSHYNNASNDGANTVNPYSAMISGKNTYYDYDYSYVSQSPNPVIRKGEASIVEIVLKNSSSQTLTKNGLNPFRLGTDCYPGSCDSNNGRDRPSEFADSSWRSNNRIDMVQDNVRPCELATFRFKINTSGSNVPIGKRKIYFTPVLENLKWLKNIGIYIEVEVK